MSVLDGTLGNEAREERHPGKFTKICLDGIGRVQVVQGEAHSVEVTAPERLLRHVVSDVVDETLHLSLEPGLRLINAGAVRLAYRVTAPVIDRLCIDGAGSFEGTRLDGDTLEVAIDGAGNISLEDTRMNALSAQIDGSGRITLTRSAVSDSCRANIDGAGKISLPELRAASLSASIDGTGKIDATGSATEAIVEIDGAGKVSMEELEAQQVAVNISGAGRARVWASRALSARVSGNGRIQYRGQPEIHSQIGGFGRVDPLRDHASL